MRPADYHLLKIYRKGCSGNVTTAEQRLAQSDAASRQPRGNATGLLRSDPESYESSFIRNAGNSTALLEYDADLARWKAPGICMRCAETFVDAPA